MAAMAHETEVRVGAHGTSKVRTINRKALPEYLEKGFFLVDDSGAPVAPDGTPYELDNRGNPIIPEPTEEQREEAERIVRPPTKEFRIAEREAAAAEGTSGLAPSAEATPPTTLKTATGSKTTAATPPAPAKEG